MKIPTRHMLVTLMFLLFVLPAWAQSPTMEHGEAIYHDTSPPLSDMAAAAARAASTGETREIPLRERPDFGRDPSDAAPDGDVASESLLRSSIASLAPTPPPSLSVPGLSEQDNINTLGIAVVPPDTNGDIGFDDSGNKIYVQYINLVWGVFNATTGAMSAGPFAGNSFWTGFGGFCETNNDGDPVVLYDDQAGRWFFSQFSVNQGIQCVAVSTTSDPLGPYHRYAFTVTPGGANDYPKLGVWDDGTSGSTGQSAYTFTTRDFGGAGGPFSVGAGVMDRDAMLAGDPASFIKFINPCVSGDCIEGQLPPHLAGPTPPAGTCPTFWTAVDAAYDDSPFTNDGYRNHILCVDWSDLGSSTYTEGPLVVAGTNFDRFLAGNVISPVNGGDPLDALQFFTMYRAQYRWFGDDARVVLNTTVDAGGDRAGIRWAEVRSADGVSGWTLRQDGTHAPADGNERWMGSIAQDGDGNIALGYSVAGPDLFPAVRYTSRGGGDPAGTMPGGEVSCHEGTGAQTSIDRWGDYSSMSIDPSDDCTFWYTQEYYETTGSFDFNTRICSFAVEGCGEACVADEPGTELSCADGLDNDCDLDFDCFDTDCADDDACICVPVAEVCDNGTDDDCDGLTDCDDVDSCSADPACGAPPAPANDLCEDAEEVQCNSTVTASTINATVDNAGFCGTSNTAPGVWYKLTNGAGQLVTASTCNQADFDTKLSVYDGECGALGCVAGRDDTPGCAGFTTELSWGAADNEQLILVHGFGSATGTFSLDVTCEAPAENDLCEDAIGPLAVDSVTAGTTTTATFDDAGFCGTSNTAPGVWYTVEGTGNTMTASTCNDGDPATGGANYDTKISVYCADCETKECIGGQDDDFGNCAGFTTNFSWPTQAGNTYNVLVHGFSNQTGDFDLAILDDGVPVAPGEANDCDGIPEAFDFCPDTVIPESVPTRHLKPTHWALNEDGEFESILPPGQAEFPHMYTFADTAGCSCEQIIDELDLGAGHTRFGCASSAMQEWVAFLESQSCGNCVEAHFGTGCENGACEAAICAIDPFCCNVAWDGLCVLEALDICVPDLCIALPSSSEVPVFYGESRGPEPEPISKDPGFVPKE